MKLTLVDHLTGAFLKRDGGNLPDWLIRGTGLVMASKAEPQNPYLQSLPVNAARSMKAMGRPGALFDDGTFSPGEVGGVGYTMVSFLLKKGGAPRFGRLVKQLSSGAKMNAALKTVYGSTAAEIGGSLFSAL